MEKIARKFRKGIGILLTLALALNSLLSTAPYAFAKESVGELEKSGSAGANVTYKVYKDDTGVRLIFEGTGKLETAPDENGNYGAHWLTDENGNKYHFKSIEVGEGITEIGTNTFYECQYDINGIEISLPDGLEKISSYAFYSFGSEYASITTSSYPDASVTLPATVTEIGERAFMGLFERKLFVKYPLHASYGNYAFSDMYGGVKKAAGYYCDGITHTYRNTDEHNFFCTVNNKSFGTEAHTYSDGVCTRCGYDKCAPISGKCGDNAEFVLTDAQRDGRFETLTISGTGAIYDYPADDRQMLCTAPWKDHANEIRTVIISDGITRIGDGAFYRLVNLNGIDIPDTITEIGDRAMSWCTMSALTLPEGVTKIENYAFDCCKNLKLHYPAHASLGTNAFNQVKEVRSYYCSAVQYTDNGDGLSHNIKCDYMKAPVKAEHTYDGEYHFDENVHWLNCTTCSARKDEAHDWNDGAIVSEPTEETEGEIIFTCTVCQETKTEVIPKTEHIHNLIYHEGVEPDCVNDGTVECWSCSKCGRNYGDAAAENQLADITVSAKGHTEVIDAAVAATCTADGKTEGKHCSVCNEVLTAQTTVRASGHAWDNGTVTTPATEDREGVKTFTCSKCNETKTEAILPLDHVHTFTYHAKVDADCVNAGTVEYWSCSKCGNNYSNAAAENQITDITISAKGHTEVIDAAVAATCTADGKTEGSHCSVCGKVIRAQANISAPGHAWNDGEVTKQPTETEAGLKTFSCIVCGETKTEKIAPLNHTHEWSSDWSGDDFSHWHECGGSCGEKKDEAAHTWDSGAITKQPTETETGVKTYTCTVCQKTKTESIPKLENENPDPPVEHTHTYSQEWASDDANHWHSATCGHDVRGDEAAHNWDQGTITKKPTATVLGEKKFECAVCGRTKTETLPATGGSGSQGGSGNPSKPTIPDEPQTPAVGSVTADTQNGENAPKAELADSLDKLADIVLTGADKKAVESGTDIKIILTVEDGTVPDSDKELVETVCGIYSFKIGEYFDVGLLKKIGGSDERIIETSAPITVVFDLSDALQKDGREFSVIRVHNGETAVLPDLDDDDKTVTVETDKFSIHALVYSEKVAPDDGNSDVQPGESDTPSGDSSEPVTGDESSSPESDSDTPENNENPATGAAISFIPLTALLAAIVVFTARKKKD